MTAGGIDIGSRFIKHVLVEHQQPVVFMKEDTGHDPMGTCRRLIHKTRPERLIATGYGRYLLEVHGETATVTEIKAVAQGAKAIFPSCRTVIDIGGQDTKVVALDSEGAVKAFEMNDRCAAGTGKFLEIMAKTLGYELDSFGTQCEETDEDIKINSMCTVFAESEVVSLISKGVPRRRIAAALHVSIVNRVVALARRVGVEDDVVFAGGCAFNTCLKGMFEQRLGMHIHVAEYPDMLAAYGAALIAGRSTEAREATARPGCDAELENR